LQGLSLTRRFAKGELDVCVGNGAKVAAIAINTDHPPLPSGLVLKLNNCYCIPALCKNIISSSSLEEVDGYEIIIKNKCCSICYNGILYAHCPSVNGLYVLDLEDNFVCNSNTKRVRLDDLNQSYPGFMPKPSTHVTCAQRHLFHTYGQKVFTELSNVMNKV
jgi:hypothetical protein